MSLDAILTSPALAGMRAIKQWLVYILVPSKGRPGKNDKIPMHYERCVPTSVVDPASWTDAQTAVDATKRWGQGFGVGFAFTRNCGYWFLDLDSCHDGQAWSPLAIQMSQVLAGAAVEVSSSGRGLHYFGRGSVPPHSNKNTDHHAELYTADRFCALSGLSLAGDCNVDLSERIGWVAQTYFAPRAGASSSVSVVDEGPCPEWRGPTDDAELIRRAMRSHSAGSVFGGSRASFADLWTGDVQALAKAYPASGDDPYDRSSADAALAQHLAFWTGRDVARIERLMRQSALVRPKWDDRDDYLVDRTIQGACGRQVDVLQDKPIEAPAPVGGVAPGVTGAAPAAAASPAPAPGPANPTGVSTAAPVMRAVEGSTFLSADQQAQLFDGCVYIIEHHRVLCPGGLLLKPESFKARFGGYTFSMDTRNERTVRNAFEAFTESQVLRCPQANGTCFRPDLPYGTLVTDAGRTRANLWWPVETPRIRGDATPFWEHLKRIVPDKRDQTILLSWMACAVQYPGRKFQCAPFLQGVEGNGKTFFSRCLSEILGKRYSHWPDASKLGEKFNGWLFGKLIICVEDIHTDGNLDILERLKPWITGTDGVEIEGKGIDQITSEICCNFIFNSNHPNGIRKTRNDRRYITFLTPQQYETDLARDGLTPEYFKWLYAWCRSGGYAVVHDVLSSYQIPDEFRFDQGIRAPDTSTTGLAIAAGYGRAEQEILEAVEQGHTGFKGGWVSSIAVDRLLDRIQRGNVPRSQRRGLLKLLGYGWHPALPDGRATQTVGVDGGRPRLYVTAGHPALQVTDPTEVVRLYSAAQISTA